MTCCKPACAAAIAALLAFSPAALSQARLTAQDRAALQKLAQADLAEIQAGKLALQKASTPEVRKFGEHMVQEHSKRLAETKALAQARGVKAPARPDGTQQEILKTLRRFSGDDFERRFMALMVEGHQDTLLLVERTARRARDPELKAHALESAGDIKGHLYEARRLYASLAASAGASRPADRRPR